MQRFIGKRNTGREKTPFLEGQSERLHQEKITPRLEAAAHKPQKNGRPSIYSRKKDTTKKKKKQ